jgi:hypothetical protein
MHRGSLLRCRAYAPVALLVVAACAGVSGSDGGIELARGHPTVVTLENGRYDPPRSIGLVGANHPGVQNEEAELRRSGFKRVDVEAMDTLLDRLEEQGLLQSGVKVDRLAPLDPRTQLARLTVTVDNKIVNFTVPRRPQKETADRYTQMARSVTELFNTIVDLRPGRQEATGDVFLEMQQKLFESNREKQKAQGKNGGAP